jgi:hypothetical protein
MRPHSKSHKIVVFAIGDIVGVKLPPGTRTAIDPKRV